MSSSTGNGPQQFDIDVVTEPGRVVVAVSGELELTTAELVQRAVDEIVLDGAASVVLDLRGVTFIDSSGLRLLLRLNAAAAADGFAFALRECAGPVRDLLELTSLRARFAFILP